MLRMGINALRICGWVIAKISSPEQSYRRSVWVCRWITNGLNLINHANTRTEGYILQWLFSVITRHGQVKLQVRLQHQHLLNQYFGEAGGILCTLHSGLTLSILSVLESQRREVVLVSDGGTTGNAHGWNWGCQHPINLIGCNAMSLFYLKKSIQVGKIGIVYADFRLSDGKIGVDPNVFQFSEKIKSPLLFYTAKLAKDGIIEIELIEPQLPALGHYRNLVEQITGEECAVKLK